MKRGYDHPYLISAQLHIISDKHLVCAAHTRCLSLVRLFEPFIFIDHDYMGCSDVSEFEHIYGQIVTTPSCVYNR